ncbi:hypothetical protein U9M48_031951 [Paspalum notatum var. saurae]|uniref:Uncharacterized protein n=1 Tax=Paspalum notatum var. saurae TaxID=547442 RepID=A0AAQ3X4Y5_PASNO
MQVPTYAKYLKDILNNKKPLPSTEIVHLTEECSATIIKRKDPGSPTISCSIGSQNVGTRIGDVKDPREAICNKLEADTWPPDHVPWRADHPSTHFSRATNRSNCQPTWGSKLSRWIN